MASSIYITRAHDAAARKIGDELMIMSGRDSSLFGLNETAALLWQAADGVTPLAEIVETQLCTTFDIDLGTAMSDAEALVAQLVEHGILSQSDQPLSPHSAAKGSNA